MTKPQRKYLRRMLVPALAAAAFLSAFTTGPAIRQAQAFGGHSFAGCTEPDVLDYIMNRFVWTDQNVLKRGLRIEAIYATHRNRLEYETETHTIGRLYCHGTALMNDGRPRTIWYLIEEGMGFASIGDNVEFCIDGLDPWHVYGAWCRSVR